MKHKSEVNMLPKRKNKKYKVTGTNVWCTINPDMPSHANDPFFIKKAQESKEFLEKVGFPEELLKIREERLKKNSNQK